MRLPRDLPGREFARRLKRHFGYELSRQRDSHLRLTTSRHGEHHVTIPDHNALRLGTLNSVVTDVAQHFSMTRDEVAERLFSDSN